MCFGVGQIPIKKVFKIPDFLAKPLLSPLLLYRRLRYGYTFRKIPLTRGKFAIVDPEDYPRIAKYKWFLTKSPTSSYAARWQRLHAKGPRKKIWMHHQVIHIPKHMVCDHINRNSLDNRKANLRPATVSQNLCNRPKTKAKTAQNTKALNGTKPKESGKPEFSSTAEKYISALSPMKSTPQKPTIKKQESFSVNLHASTSPKISYRPLQSPKRNRRFVM